MRLYYCTSVGARVRVCLTIILSPSNSHNLGLLHANEGVLGAEESRYQDFSGYMSGSQSTYMSEKYPIQCFNGANHWELQWYKTSGHAHEVFPQVAPEIVYIGAFADRNKFLNDSGSQEYAVVKVGDFYLQYNGAWGINVHTNEAANRLTITQQWDDGTYLVGDIDNIQGRSWTLHRIDWSIQICDVAQGSSSTPDVLKVWIGTGTPDCTLTSTPPTNDGDCKGHQQTCATDDDCCSQSCRPTGNGSVCLPNPNAHQLKNELRISRHHQLAKRRTSALRGSRSDYRRQYYR